VDGVQYGELGLGMLRRLDHEICQAPGLARLHLSDAYLTAPFN
jgi:hypothetical protein